MTFEQKVQLWMVVGTWVAGLATLGAVMTSLYFARSAEKVRLRIFVGIRVAFSGDGSLGKDYVCFDATNVGERPVIITTVGWVVGKRKKNRKYCIQPLFESWSQQCPVELTHGKNAKLMVPLDGSPGWVRGFKEFLDDTSDQSLKTLRAQVFTSVGKTFEIKPEGSLIDLLREDC